MKTSIYIITQAKYDFPKFAEYKPLHVGMSANKSEFELNDSTGESISEKNPFYCELTGQYWIWKNDKDSDIIGLCHYRRFLWLNEIKRRLCRKIFKNMNDAENFLNPCKVETILNNYDIILPRPYVFSGDTIKTQFIKYHGQENYDLMTSAVQKRFPEYMETLETVFNRRFEYFANLLLTKRYTFNKYSKWLFKILSEIEPQVDFNDEKNRRLMGYFSERLLNVYVVYNKFNIKEVPQIFIANDDEQDLYIDLRYIKRRYFAKLLAIEESIRNKLKRK